MANALSIDFAWSVTQAPTPNPLSLDFAWTVSVGERADFVDRFVVLTEQRADFVDAYQVAAGQLADFVDHYAVLGEVRADFVDRSEIEPPAVPIVCADHQHWGFRILLGGVDVTNDVVGVIETDAEESAASIATFSRLYTSPFVPGDDIGKSVEIYFRRRDNVGVLLEEQIMFVGVVHEPDLDLIRRTVRYRCTDKLQLSLENMTREQIDSVVGGCWHESLFDDSADGWEYAQDRLSTIPASLDIPRGGGTPQLFPWVAKSVPDFEFDEDHLRDLTPKIDLTELSELHNVVRVETKLRYDRLWQRFFSDAWLYGRSHVDYLIQPTTLPNKSMVLDAASQTGWHIHNAQFTEQPESDLIETTPGNFVAWVKARTDLIYAATIGLIRRWRQTLTQTQVIEVRAPASVARHGELTTTKRASFSSGETVEWDQDSLPPYRPGIQTALGGPFPKPPNSQAFGPYLYGDTLNVAETREYLDCVLAQAATDLIRSHRQNQVTFSLVCCTPEVERHHTVRLMSRFIDVVAQVSRVRHKLDIDSGESTTEITLSVMRGGGDAGGTVVATPVASNVSLVAPPTVPAEPEPENQFTQLGQLSATQPEYVDSRSGYSGNYEPIQGFGAPTFPLRFDWATPSIPTEYAESVDDVEGPATNIVVVIPDDELVI